MLEDGDALAVGNAVSDGELLGPADALGLAEADGLGEGRGVGLRVRPAFDCFYQRHVGRGLSVGDIPRVEEMQNDL